MNEQATSQAGQARPVAEAYPQQGNAALEANLAQRSAEHDAAFFLPHLTPGMRLLDCGCGPGSITLGLAEVVAPGEVVGVDIQPHLIEQARARATERGVVNARFERASIYELPFPDASFDAAFMHAVVIYLQEPVRALQEIRRVLRPGGIVGIRELDLGTQLLSPLTPLLEETLALWRRVLKHNGGDPFRGRHLRQLLREAGFARNEATAAVVSCGSLAETRSWAPRLQALIQGLARTGIDQGWVDTARVDGMLAELQRWGQSPDAFHAWTLCDAVGWAGSGPMAGES